MSEKSQGPFHDVAKLMEARLEGWEALQDVPVIIDQQKDIESEAAAGVAKEAGCAVTILFEGFRSVDPDTAGPRVRARFAIRAWGLPIMEEVDPLFVPTETAMAEVAKALHHYKPSGRTVLDECRVEDGDLVPDMNFLVYECFVSVTVQL